MSPWLRRAVVLVILGVFLSLVAAWARAAVPLQGGLMLIPPIQPREWPRPAPNGWGEPSRLTIHTHVGAVHHVYTGDAVQGNRLLENMDVYAFGWPLECVEATTVYGGARFASQTYGALQIGPISLPVRPIWPGLIANALVYACAIAGVRYGVPALRRRWRGRRGQCLACGYDLQGVEATGCPECGVKI